MTPVEKEGLRKWRRRSPEVIASLAIAPLAWHLGLFAMNEKLVWSLIVPAFGYIVSFLYEAFDIRGGLWRDEMESYVGKQIKDKIVALIPSELEVTPDEIDLLRNREIMKRLTGVFWETVDEDDQLKSHKEAFYNNGKYYSSSFDVFIITGVVGYLYLFGLQFELTLFFPVTCLVLVTLSLFAWYYLIPEFRERHLALSLEQLEQLGRRRTAAVQDNIRRIISEMRSKPITREGK